MIEKTTALPSTSQLTRELCNQARIERDPIYDGRFYFAVITTGIYCRPVCPARRARAANVRYFESAAAAAEAGFRPCRRCRPEQAPVPHRGDQGIVDRALVRIEEGALDEGSVAGLARELSIGERRLRRVFRSTLGASPVQVAGHRRLLLARQMLERGDASVIDIAFASGFNSLRRFNEAFKAAFDASPSSVRQLGRAGTEINSGADLTLRFAVRRPMDGEGLLRFLAARAIPGVECVQWRNHDGDEGVPCPSGYYQRSFVIGDTVGQLCCRFLQAETNNVDLQIELRFSARPERLPSLLPLVERVKDVFDLGFDPIWIDAFRDDPRLGPALHSWPGIRVPGCLDPFELAVRAILGQQITVAGATTLSGRIAERWGRRLGASHDWERGNQVPTVDHACGPTVSLLFPTAEALQEAPLEEAGLTKARSSTLRVLATTVSQQPDLFDRQQSLDDFVKRFTELPGIGPWTAHYVAMRALRKRDAFLSGDLVLRKALAGERGELPSTKQVERIGEGWRPYRAYASMLLWRRWGAEQERRPKR